MKKLQFLFWTKLKNCTAQKNRFIARSTENVYPDGPESIDYINRHFTGFLICHNVEIPYRASSLLGETQDAS